MSSLGDKGYPEFVKPEGQITKLKSQISVLKNILISLMSSFSNRILLLSFSSKLFVFRTF